MVSALMSQSRETYPALFYRTVLKTLENEGGYVNHPNDPGGETNFGISKRSFPDVNIKALNKKKAIQIYYEKFWKNQNFYLLNDEKLVYKVFDMSVLMGTQRAVRILQETLNDKGAKLKLDGLLGELTANSANKNIRVLEDYILNLEKYFRNLVKERPSQKVFLKGWLRRANK